MKKNAGVFVDLIAVQMKRSFALILLLCLSAYSHGANKPCSGKKGGISHCESGRFICNDGSVSQSKRACSFSESKK